MNKYQFVIFHTDICLDQLSVYIFVVEDFNKNKFQFTFKKPVSTHIFISTRNRSQMRLRTALRTPQSEITLSSVVLFSSPSRSELLVEPHELVVPETPHKIYLSIIPTTDSLVKSLEFSPALTKESYFDIGESPVSPTILSQQLSLI